MIRNYLTLNSIGIRAKTVVHIGAGSGEDRELYTRIGARNLIWVEANIEIYEKLLHSYPFDSVLNFYATNSDTNQGSPRNFDSNKPTFKLTDSGTPTQSLDQAFLDWPLENPLLLVIDTDGAEVDILCGASFFLKKVNYVVIEQHLYWDDKEWHKEISRLMSDNGFFRTLSRPNHTQEYEDVLWTRFGKSRIRYTIFLDSAFLILRQLKHIFKNGHFSTTSFNCEVCNSRK